MKKFLLSLCVIMVAFVIAKDTHATRIDFEGLPFNIIENGGDLIPSPDSVLTDNFINDGLLFGRAGISKGVAVLKSDSLAPSSGFNSIGGLDAFGNLPGTNGAAIGDIFFEFVLPSSHTSAFTDFVQFTVGDVGGDIDMFKIYAYGLNDQLIYNQSFSNISRFSVSIAMQGIQRVEIDFSGDFGYSLDDLNFNTPFTEAGTTPEPATLLLLGAGIVGLAGMRKKFYNRII